MNSKIFSDVGKVRQNNEDYSVADDNLGLYILADGMGGHNAGEVASELAVKTAYAYLTERIAAAGDEEISTLLVSSIATAHEVVNAKARTDLSLMGMGSTLVTVAIRSKRAFICHAGDSRAYHYNGSLQQITHDHTMGDYLLDNKLLSREQIPEKQWHTLTQAVGVGEAPVSDCRVVDLADNDLLFLCSDGLTDMLSNSEIETIIDQGRLNIDLIGARLIKAVHDKGARDNTSIVLVAP